jgi:hypothetical protein
MAFLYGLQDELTPEVEDKDVTVLRADLGRVLTNSDFKKQLTIYGGKNSA